MLHFYSSGVCSMTDICGGRHSNYFTLAGLVAEAFTNLVAGMVFFAAMDLAGTRFSMGTDLGVESQKPARQQMSFGCYRRETENIDMNF